MARPRSEATERWHAERAVNWRQFYGQCASLEEIVAADAAIRRRCAAVKNRVAERPVDRDAFHKTVDSTKESRLRGQCAGVPAWGVAGDTP